MTQDWHDLLLWHASVHTKMRSGRAHGYFQSQRVTVYKEVGRPTHDSIKREQALVKVTNDFITKGERILIIVRLTGLGSYLANGCETGSVLGFR